ncbi:hypothetical protein [uncultured Chitinophaga sp.]|uniref:hypothetical protein n=1 Tax=uncultured Chitinophaga sp. TaxID=339340 RepID=UPI0025E21A41|nr:hypothetical protein [uncultured Chitinophaga sp.]
MKSKEGLIDGFVVRTDVLNVLKNEIDKSNLHCAPANFLIIGPRGAGKTTLLHRLKYAIEDDLGLDNVLTVMLTEEQYNITDITTLWLRVIEYGQDWYGWNDISNRLQHYLESPKVNNRDLYELLLSQLGKQRLFIFIENINIFFKKLGTTQQEELKAIIAPSCQINFIASSTVSTDSHVDFSDIVFDYFKLIELKGLTRKECEKLLLNIAEDFGQRPQLEDIIRNHPGRIESLRRLTGGTPRTITYLFQILLDNKGGRALTDLYQAIDTLTILYKSEIDQLSIQQQQVIDVMAKNWDAIAVKDIVKSTRLESKNVSSILATLEKNSLIEKIPTKTKNNLYRIKERFLNIWYLMRFGRKAEKENVKWLVRFYDMWCDELELSKRISAYLDDIKGGGYNLTAAIDMGNTYISCQKAPAELRYRVYKETLNLLPGRLEKTIKISDEVLYKRINSLVEQNKHEEALEVLEEVKEHDEKYFAFLLYIHFVKKNFVKAAEAGQKLLQIEPKNGKAAITLGLIYDEIKDIEQAEKYYELALRLNHKYAATKMANIAYYYKDDTRSAIDLHKKAIKRKIKESYIELAGIYAFKGDLSEAEKIHLQAVHDNIEGAHRRLGLHYEKTGKYELAESSFEQAIQKRDWIAEVFLATLELKKTTPSLDRVQNLLESAINHEITQAYAKLGKFFLYERNDKERAKDILKTGVEKGDADSAHQLGHFYDAERLFELSDEMFVTAIKLGHESSVFCLANSIYNSARNSSKAFALEQLEKNSSIVNKYAPYGPLLHANILLWNGKEQDAIKEFRSTYSQISILINSSETDRREQALEQAANSLSKFMLQLLALERYDLCIDLFEDQIDGVDMRSVLKPLYFVLMEARKQDFPVEYLKAGAEFTETIKEVKEKISELKKNLNYI